ncbi:MAG TPA: hypothetical protein ENI05_10465 [Porticoccus sp.]|nr:hypothetical protein [Porticoccus sp.]
MRQSPELDPRKCNVEKHVIDKASTLTSPHAAQPDELLAVLSSSHHGLSRAEAEAVLSSRRRVLIQTKWSATPV